MEHLNSYGLWWGGAKSIIGDGVTPELLVTIVVMVLFSILWYKLRTSTSTSPPLPPGPRSLPIVGYLPFLKPNLHKQFTNMAHTYGPIFKFYIGNKLTVVVNTPDLVKEVVRDQDSIFANRNLTVASSIVTYGGEDLTFSKNWRKLRKIFVQEVLSSKNLEACGYFRKDEVRKTIKEVFSKIGTKVNVSDISFLTETNVVKRMVWGNSADEVGEDIHLETELPVVSAKIMEYLAQPNVSDFFPSLSWLDLQGIKRNMKRQIKKLDRIFDRIIEDRVKSNSKELKDGFGEARKQDFLQILLEVNDKNDATSLNINQIKALLMDAMVGGTETAATLIEWAMAEIIKNHQVMDRIQEELADIVGVNNIVEESHLVKLQYLEATVKETFRLHPIGPLLMPRVSSQDCTVGGYTIPKGTNLFLNVWSIHRDPRYWDNPLDFNPERFLTNENTCDFNGNNLKFMPFGSGRRMCPGIPLAEKMQMYILASLLHSFDWSLPDGEPHDFSDTFGITLKKTNPLIAIPSQRLHDVSLYV